MKAGKLIFFKTLKMKKNDFEKETRKEKYTNSWPGLRFAHCFII